MIARDVINWIIQEKKYKSYLEIGTHRNHTFDAVQCEKKVGVDPTFNTTFKMRSDTFFKQNQDKFDMIFIDGDHSASQVKKDIENSLAVLNEDGTIVLHDVNPRREYLIQRHLCYNAWWAFAQLRTERKDMWMCTLPFDHLGCIRHGTQELYSEPIKESWKFLDENREELMNEIDWETFITYF